MNDMETGALEDDVPILGRAEDDECSSLMLHPRSTKILDVFQKWQSEKNKIDKLTASLQCTEGQSSRSHVYFAEDREEARELELQSRNKSDISAIEIPKDIKKKMERSYKDLEARKSRAKNLEKIYMDMLMQKELQKKGRKRKLREDEILNPNGKPVYKWRADRKR